MMELEMASVEAQHAIIRRMQHVLSTQTHNEHIKHGSAEYYLRRFRNLGVASSKAAVWRPSAPPK